MQETRLHSVPAHVKDFEWHVIPVVNPDGYEFSWGGGLNRRWRKNRLAGTVSYMIFKMKNELIELVLQAAHGGWPLHGHGPEPELWL